MHQKGHNAGDEGSLLVPKALAKSSKEMKQEVTGGSPL